MLFQISPYMSSEIEISISEYLVNIWLKFAQRNSSIENPNGVCVTLV